ncbi:hypothetical protein JL09_g5074 [Pichia kudriavzevii]|uniref:Uncharacterized protein n=1 Tax=Pichia kudriavzevii TaxID=4909 RepID=A0A099NV36_PICKU|nr:hypothetical protein JL09_g5075 [Pichia kudriavzevii]KGK35776.1 hypothetical protein JL09_g5074 [Pichia kudriavzevii]
MSVELGTNHQLPIFEISIQQQCTVFDLLFKLL